MAFEMMEYAKKTKIEGLDLILKIGIHRGRVIAGVIGNHKPQFSLIGDTVNTTSRVCSTGEEGSIIISSEAYEVVKELDLRFAAREVYVRSLTIPMSCGACR
jgi:class 3 adenylate cyclase